MISDQQKSRLHVVDALRGFAIVAIMLLHNIEHFDVYFFPETLPGWMISLDKIVWDTLFFLFAGKSYAIFALLFGLTFFIQSDNQEKKGKDFSARFAWRLLLLLGFGVINSAFFEGDILMIYAAIGFLLIPMRKLSDGLIFGLAIILILQPYEWFNLYYAVQHPLEEINDPASWAFFGKMMEYMAGDSMMATLWGNLTNGKWAVLLWNWENGRYFHILALFLLGMLAGRKGLFATSEENKAFWKKVLIYAGIAFVPLYAIQQHLESFVTSPIIRRSVSMMETSWTNVAFMLVLVSGFYLVFHRIRGRKMLNVFAPIGKMSLSNYVFQSIIGAFIYHGYGLGLYQVTGATYGMLIGITMAILTGYCCSWWAKRYKHGPLEGLWHKATWIGTK